MTHSSDDTMVVGRRAGSTSKMLVLIAVTTGGLVAFALISSKPHLLLYLILLIKAVVDTIRPPTVVSSRGISRPWRRRSLIEWSAVASVETVQPGFPSVRITLTDGPTLSLTDVPAEETLRVAAIGGKPVADPFLPTRRPAAAPAAADDSDINRRLQALNAGWEKLATQNRYHTAGPRPQDKTNT